MAGVNRVIILGNLGAEPEGRFLPSGGAVTNVRIATSESWKDKNTGEKQEKTEWHRVIFFNRLAEIASDYLHKGSKVYIEGALRTRKWQDKEGRDQYTTEIVASSMQLLDARGDHSEQVPRQPQSSAPRQQPQHAAIDDPYDSDIPF